MALEGTHMRFALDLKEKFNVKDLNKYLSGSVYPDSRNVSGLERIMTHDDKFLDKKFFIDNDFKKGWAAHLIYDKIQAEVMFDLLKDFLESSKDNRYERWCKLTAIKVIQDIDDIKKFNIHDFLFSLNYIENPNNENLERIQFYNETLFLLYEDPNNISFEDYKKMWLSWGVSREPLNKVYRYFLELNDSLEFMDLILKIYPKTIEKSLF